MLKKTIGSSGIKHSLLQALEEISSRSLERGISWIVGGSTSLLLQDVPLQAALRDLDLYVDLTYAASMHEALLAYAVDVPQESETAMYRSVLSHYELHGVKVELVGAFEVRSLDSEYRVEAQYLAQEHAAQLVLPGGGSPVSLTPLVHELVFNLLRGRPDRYEAAAEVCRRSSMAGEHQRLLELLVQRNRFSADAAFRLRSLLDPAAPAVDFLK